jgi:hypothetical protein
MIPPLMRTRRRWLMWKWEWKPKKNGGQGGWDKPPLQVSGRNASSTNPRTWTDLDTALAAYQTGKFDGIGFALGWDEEIGVWWTGVDFDKVADALGNINVGTLWHIHSIDSYTERSPSWTGVKILAMGKLPPGGRHEAFGEDGAGIEMYDSGRYFTVTTQHLEGTPLEVKECSLELAQLHDRLISKESEWRARMNSEPPEEKPPPPPPRPGGKFPTTQVERIKDALAATQARAASYQEWLEIGMAIHSFDPALLWLWEEWSRLCPSKFQEGVCAKKWRSFKKSGRTLGTLFYHARQAGWDDPWKARQRIEKIEQILHHEKEARPNASSPNGEEEKEYHPNEWCSRPRMHIWDHDEGFEGKEVRCNWNGCRGCLCYKKRMETDRIVRHIKRHAQKGGKFYVYKGPRGLRKRILARLCRARKKGEIANGHYVNLAYGRTAILSTYPIPEGYEVSEQGALAAGKEHIRAGEPVGKDETRMPRFGERTTVFRGIGMWKKKYDEFKEEPKPCPPPLGEWKGGWDGWIKLAEDFHLEYETVITPNSPHTIRKGTIFITPKHPRWGEFTATLHDLLQGTIWRRQRWRQRHDLLARNPVKTAIDPFNGHEYDPGETPWG